MIKYCWVCGVAIEVPPELDLDESGFPVVAADSAGEPRDRYRCTEHSPLGEWGGRKRVGSPALVELEATP
jgi:hypothetical protein